MSRSFIWKAGDALPSSEPTTIISPLLAIAGHPGYRNLTTRGRRSCP